MGLFLAQTWHSARFYQACKHLFIFSVEYPNQSDVLAKSSSFCKTNVRLVDFVSIRRDKMKYTGS